MVIMGIDPGYAITGYGILDYRAGRFQTLDYGTIETQPDTPFPKRLLAIDEGLSYLINKFHPEAIAVEELFFSRNKTTAIGTAQARGVAVVTGARAAIPVFEYTPVQVKLAVTGYGRAEKNQVQEMVRCLLSLRQLPKPDDAADALAVGICHAHSGGRKEDLAVGNHLFD